MNDSTRILLAGLLAEYTVMIGRQIRFDEANGNAASEQHHRKLLAEAVAARRDMEAETCAT